MWSGGESWSCGDDEDGRERAMTELRSVVDGEASGYRSMGHVHGVMITMIRMIVFDDTPRNVSMNWPLWFEHSTLSSLSVSS